MGMIRLLLALSVVAGHCNGIFGLDLVGGRIAVQSFYMISGFYMSLILNEKYVGNDSYWLFLSNRLLKIYPIYWVILLGSVGAFILLSWYSNGHISPVVENYKKMDLQLGTKLYLLFTQVFIFLQDSTLFTGINAQTGSLFLTSNFNTANVKVYTFLFIPQAWTLGIELAFYVLAPFIVRRGSLTLLSLAIASLLLRIFIIDILNINWDPWTYRFFPTELLFFLLGSLSYRLYKRFQENLKIKSIGMGALVFMSVFTVLYSKIPASDLKVFGITFSEMLYLLAVFAFLPVGFSAFKKSKIDTMIGELSYPVYICHILVYTILAATPYALLHTGQVVAVISIGAAALLNILIQKPIEKFRQSRIPRKEIDLKRQKVGSSNQSH
jgi:peptidoglycan/LPS O-acetylase OafA/YrhL